jgi:hypothetical protein
MSAGDKKITRRIDNRSRQHRRKVPDAVAGQQIVDVVNS